MEKLRKNFDQIAHIIDNEAGLVNEDGMIIAATNSNLLATEEPTAKSLLNAEEEEILIQSGRIYKKLQDNGDKKFVVFIDGQDNITKNYLDLISIWLSSSMQETDVSSAREAFLKNVLLENELPGDIPLKAREYKIPYAVMRVALLVHLEQGEEIKCMDILQLMFADQPTHIVFPMDEQNIVVLIEKEEGKSFNVDKIAEYILKGLKKENLQNIHVGIGMLVNGLQDAAKSYREASLALTVGSIFENDTEIVRYDNLGLGRLIYQLPPTLCHMFLDEIFEPGAYELLDGETLLTIQKFFENNLNGSETSRQLFVHRNTLVYRLDKVQKITDLDLRKFDDAVLFKLASMVRKYLESQEGSSFLSRAGKWHQKINRKN